MTHNKPGRPRSPQPMVKYSTLVPRTTAESIRRIARMDKRTQGSVITEACNLLDASRQLGA